MPFQINFSVDMVSVRNVSQWRERTWREKIPAWLAKRRIEFRITSFDHHYLHVRKLRLFSFSPDTTAHVFLLAFRTNNFINNREHFY